MPSQEEIDELKRRIAELEAELAEARQSHEANAAKLLEAEVKADQNWGEFNPG